MIEGAFKVLQVRQQRWQTERLRAVKTLPTGRANLHRTRWTLLERSAAHAATYPPDSGLSALIKRYRKGQICPQPHVYESMA
jgi:hypothetical protein